MNVYGSLAVSCMEATDSAVCCNAMDSLVGPNSTYRDCLCVSEVLVSEYE